MTSSLKTLSMVCFIFAASSASTSQAGLLDGFFSSIGIPSANRPQEQPKPVPAAPAQPEVVVVQPPPQQTTVIQAQPPQPQALDQPTVQAEPEKPAEPTQKDLNESLWLASLQGNSGRIRGLVEQGADPKSGTPHGETPLHVAASRGHLKPIIYLANHGGSINARTKNGWTPLHHAARFGHYQAVKYLLHMGAIPHIRTIDKGRKSPMEMALDNGYVNIAELFGYRPQ